MSETRWLSSDEQRAWRNYVEATQLLMDSLDRQLQREAGLSLADYELFVRLSEAPGHRMRMSELAAKTLFSRSRLSHAVSRLEKQGWVRRDDCAEDRRGTFAELTDEGYKKLVDTAPGHVDAVRRHLIERLTDEQVQQLAAIAIAVREPFGQ